MTLETIFLFSGAALILCLLPGKSGRNWGIYVASIAAVFLLQPVTPIRNLDFWLAVASLAGVVFSWLAVRPAEKDLEREDLLSLGVIIALVVLVGLTRFFEPLRSILPMRPPVFWQVGLILTVLTGLGFGFYKLGRGRGWVTAVILFTLLAAFVVLKLEVLGQWVSVGLRVLAGQSGTAAQAGDLRWLGFSYLAFRLIHTLRDRQLGRSQAASLRTYLSYVLFFGSLTAGPIDRLERFSKDLEKPIPERSAAILGGGQRLCLGLFKKFVLADTLALAALSPTNWNQIQSTGWGWVMLYAYALRIYFDFSGYTDMALGMGRLLGIQLPENFNQPYLKSDLTSFWNCWHITLAQWFRAYFFNPLTRALRSKAKFLPVTVVILTGQVLTMLLIGLWHGITWNFLIWGLWHGLGLFIHNRWSEFTRKRGWEVEAGWQKPLGVFNTLLTFNYVALGWIWFALPNPGASLSVLARLFGGG